MSSRPPLPAKALSFAVLTALAPAAQAAVHNWSNGSFVAGATAPHPMLAGDVLNILTGGNKSFISTTWTQQGTVNWTDNTLFGGSATVNNEGLWDSQSDSNTFNFNVGGQPSFVNTGEFRKSTGIQTNMGNWQFTNDGGAINAQTGVINFNTASNTFNNGGIFKGAGVVRVSGGASFNGDFVSDNLEIAGGTNSGSNARLMGGAAGAGAVTWSGGSLTGSWELSSGTTLIGADGTTKQLVNHDVTNNGTILWQSTADLHGGSGTLTNNGLFEAQANARLNHNIGGQPIFVNSASGTLRAADGISFTNLDFNFVNNGGALDARSGGQLVFEGNANSFNDGTQFIGAGRIRVASNATFSGNYTSANLELESGTASGNNANKAIAHGTTKWTGGSINGTWELASGHTLVGADGAAKQLVNHNVTNNGTILWQTTNNITGGGGTLINNGLFEFQTNADMTHTSGGQPAFANNGMVRKSAGAGETSLASISFSNNGVVDVQSGSIRLPNGFTNNGILMGVGSFATNTLTNAGHVAPGASPGSLSIDANFAQTSVGVLDIELGNLASFDQLLVDGTATLDGFLALSCFGDCGFVVGDEITILDSTGNLTGEFSAGVTLTGFNTGAFDVIYDYSADEVRLLVTQDVTAVPEPEAWAMLLAGLGLVGVAVRRRRC